MIFKDKSLNFSALAPQLVLALVVIEQVMQRHGQEVVITSANDARHAKTSLHYSGNGIDIRSRALEDPLGVLGEIKEALGFNPDFDIIIEAKGGVNEHFHLEYQPKRR